MSNPMPWWMRRLRVSDDLLSSMRSTKRLRVGMVRASNASKAVLPGGMASARSLGMDISHSASSRSIAMSTASPMPMHSFLQMRLWMNSR